MIEINPQVAYLKTIAIPGSCIVIGTVATRLLLETDQHAAETETLLLGAIVCSACGTLAWWIISCLYALREAVLTRRGVQSAPSKVWIPRFIRHSAFALVGLTIVAPSATAVPASSWSTEYASPFFNDTHQVPTSDSTSAQADPAAHPRSEDHNTGGASMVKTLTISQTSNYVPFSPFFQNPAEKEPDLPTYTVRSGDTLWALAAQELNTTDPVRIADGVQRLFEANHHVLASPDSLIYPGQELRIPKNF